MLPLVVFPKALFSAFYYVLLCTVFFEQLCSSWQDFNRHSASRDPSVAAELLTWFKIISVMPRVIIFFSHSAFHTLSVIEVNVSIGWSENSQMRSTACIFKAFDSVCITFDIHQRPFCDGHINFVRFSSRFLYKTTFKFVNSTAHLFRRITYVNSPISPGS